MKNLNNPMGITGYSIYKKEAKERKKRLEEGIFIEDETWKQIVKIADDLGVDTKI